MKQAVIMLDGLTKSYGKHRGIENLTYSVLPGEIFGFIGPNGAGKTTTIRTLMGLLKPTSGNATIFGLDCTQHAAEIAKNVGYLPSENCYYNNLKVKEQLEMLNDFPRILMVMFGVSEDLNTALGWYRCSYFWVATIYCRSVWC